MKVKNRKYIRMLSWKKIRYSSKRNAITMVAIALTTLMFTSLFTIAMSLNETYQNYMFRQVGGYAHGCFKEVNEEKIARISTHPKIKENGVRTIIGRIETGEFSRVAGEVSYMDSNVSKWCYAVPTQGRMPQSGKEIAMDTTALEKLGVEPVLGSEIPLTFTLSSDNPLLAEQEITDTFVLVGYWTYDNVVPAHFLNISKEYVDQVAGKYQEISESGFRTDLYVMLFSTINMQQQMESVDEELGYRWDGDVGEDRVRLGVNWGYTTARVEDFFSLETCIAMFSFLLLVMLTGYLIIYNIFQIAVAEDIHFYGLLKTIGVTPRQLKRLIRQQALFLCILGIPVGLLTGYSVGAVLTPLAIQNTTFGLGLMKRSSSVFIFVFATVFSIVTVLLSCEKPGRMAGKVSPIEAVRYTDVTNKKKEKKYRGAKVHQMALANLGRNPQKTALVLTSLSLSVVILNLLVSFVAGFDMDTYLKHLTCSDFVVSTAEYFMSGSPRENITKEQIQMIEEHVNYSVSGVGYVNGDIAKCWMSEDEWVAANRHYMAAEDVERILEKREKKGNMVLENLMLEGLDQSLLNKLRVVKGTIDPLLAGEENQIAIVVEVNDFDQVEQEDVYPEIGETFSVRYCKTEYIDSRTGKPADEETPFEYYEEKITEQRDVDYTVCAYVAVAYSMGYRYSSIGYKAILPATILEKDSGQNMVRMVYLFDTPDQVSEEAAEAYLHELTNGNTTQIQYESKKLAKEEFDDFKNMFFIMGGTLCIIMGLIGILNFFNAIMTGMLARKKEFAILQAIGMTVRQIKQMLIYEGLLYAVGSGIISLGLCLLFQPLITAIFEKMVWFYKPHFVILPVLIMIPVFAGMGYLVPFFLSRQMEKQSVVEKLTRMS